MNVSLHLNEEDIKRIINRQLANDGYKVDAIGFRMSQRDYNGDPELEATVVLEV